MAKDLLRYDLMVQDALKGVVRKLLTEAAKNGLPGDHHFDVSFSTEHPGVRLSQRLRDKYPQEMTVVLQHQFWDLGVTEHAFEVGLSFSGVPERLLVPFDAITGFFDPSVQFGLKFEIRSEVPEGSEAAPAAKSGQPARGARVGARRVAAETGRGPGAQEPCAQTRGEAEARGWPRRQGDASFGCGKIRETGRRRGARRRGRQPRRLS